MPSEPRDHKRLALPPGFTAVAASQPWQAALDGANAAPAGTIWHAPLAGILDMALLLAPDQPVDDVTVLRLITIAVRNALIATLPPESSVTPTVPEMNSNAAHETAHVGGSRTIGVSPFAAGSLFVNQGEAATLRLARGTTAANAIPAWIVIGITVRVALNLPAPGLTPWQTDLAEEGAAISAAALLEGICRHLLAAIDLWNEHGAPGITRAWRAILPLPDTLQPA